MSFDKKKTRRAINISLQSKKYAEPINEMIQQWENENLNISTQVCDALLLVERLKQFSSLSNIFKIVNMLESLSTIYGYSEKNMDTMLNQIIHIDNDKFSEILIELNDVQFDETVMEKMKEKRMEQLPRQKEERKMEEETSILTEEKKEEITERKETEEKNLEKLEKKEETIETEIEEIPEETNEIPLDFLWNS